MKSEYDFIAIIYDPVLYIFLKPIRIAVMNMLLEYKEKSILDLCCGTGNQLKLLSKNGFKDLHCLDISNKMLEIAKKNNSSIKIYNGDATKTNFKNESFDIIIISFALHEKNKITQKKIIEEVYRLIKKEGFILIVDYNFDTNTDKFIKILINLIERMGGKEHYINFKNYIRNSGLLSLIKKEKFTLIKGSKKLFNGVVISMYQKTIP
ncbi:MAG: methyltransferase [delta proteobacterium ML8_D]|jgi:ubiquinone/menaquinone biosynthesis C-methylase UbiE|nr:MAG: methyltransferase [delta proteobacterium ML8_D]